MAFPELKTILRRWPNANVPEDPCDERPHERLRMALADLRNEAEKVGPGDLANRIRHSLRFEEGRSAGTKKLALPPGLLEIGAEGWKRYGFRVRPLDSDGLIEIEALPWRPEWLNVLHLADGSKMDEAEGTVTPFLAAESEVGRGPRSTTSENSGPVCDPAFSEGVGITHFLSAAQAETVRATVFSPPGSVRLVVLPTGSGKSLVGLAAAMLGKGKTGLSVIVVPTVALAFDQVESAKVLFSGAAIDTWHSGLGKGERAAILERIKGGTQRLLFTSPEGVVGSLKPKLLEVAKQGLLRAFVIDEAHLVGQWGASFRPEFQTMSPLWNELRRVVPEGRDVFRTVLMTATATAETYGDLRRFYDPDGTMETLASVSLRPEPNYFLAPCDTPEEKERRVLETLRHAPRPAILYVTKVEDAKAWRRRCREEGWKRVGLIHGETSPADRESAILKWRRSELDLMVATSAFGLGMDEGDVRLVLHACVPETVDRYYQEVGRGGRDGRACAAIMIWEPEDFRLAKRMNGRSTIGDEKGFSRWTAMWDAAEHESGPDGDISFINLQQKRRGLDWDGERNMKWNIRTLLLLAGAGVLKLEHTDPPEMKRLPDEADEIFQKRCDDLRAGGKALFAVRLIKPAPRTRTAWDEAIAPFRAELSVSGKKSWNQLKSVIERRSPLNDVLCEVYQVPEAGIYHVSRTSEDIAPEPKPLVGCELGANLQRWFAQSGITIGFVTYPAAGVEERELARKWIEILELMARAGIRELALPKAWRERVRWSYYPNPILAMMKAAPESYLVVRDLEEDVRFSRHQRLPRVSFLPPEFSGARLPEFLLSAERNYHLIMLPENCPDPSHPERKIGDTRGNVIAMGALARLLNL